MAVPSTTSLPVPVNVIDPVAGAARSSVPLPVKVIAPSCRRSRLLILREYPSFRSAAADSRTTNGYDSEQPWASVLRPLEDAL